MFTVFLISIGAYFATGLTVCAGLASLLVLGFLSIKFLRVATNVAGQENPSTGLLLGTMVAISVANSLIGGLLSFIGLSNPIFLALVGCVVSVFVLSKFLAEGNTGQGLLIWLVSSGLWLALGAFITLVGFINVSIIGAIF